MLSFLFVFACYRELEPLITFHIHWKQHYIVTLILIFYILVLFVQFIVVQNRRTPQMRQSIVDIKKNQTEKSGIHLTCVNALVYCIPGS